MKTHTLEAGQFIEFMNLGERCSTKAGAKVWNPVEALKNIFFGLFSQLLKLRFTAMDTYSFHFLICFHSQGAFSWDYSGYSYSG